MGGSREPVAGSRTPAFRLPSPHEDSGEPGAGGPDGRGKDRARPPPGRATGVAIHRPGPGDREDGRCHDRRNLPARGRGGVPRARTRRPGPGAGRRAPGHCRRWRRHPRLPQSRITPRPRVRRLAVGRRRYPVAAAGRLHRPAAVAGRRTGGAPARTPCAAPELVSARCRPSRGDRRACDGQRPGNTRVKSRAVLAAGGSHRVSSIHDIDVGGDMSYRIHVGPGLLDDGAALAAHVRGRHVLLASDDNVAPLYAARVVAALAAHSPAQVRTSSIVPGEASKTMDAFAALMHELADFGATRDACVFALGGGVVGDLAGFAAACWMRGIDCVQLPTTLLAMVDSSVGGKTAVDLPQGKNLVGAFHPPRAVFADTTTLRTLPDRELRAGLAEVVKYGAIMDAAFLDWLEDNAGALLARGDHALAEAIARSCA